VRKLEAEGYQLADQLATGSPTNRVVAYLLRPPEQADELLLGDKVPRLLIYWRPPREQPQLIFEDEGSDQFLEFAGIGYNWPEILGWQDINGDGLRELAVWAANGGYCWACTRVYLLQLIPQAEGAPQVNELTGAVPFLNLITNPFVPKALGDLDGDGLLEIEVLDGRFESAFGLERVASPGLYRVFDWDGSSYTDATRRFPGYVEYQGQRAREILEASYEQPLTYEAIGKAVLILLAYAARGQREEGWALFWELSDPARWPGEITPGVAELLSRIREHLRGQYERGEVFLPWVASPPLPPSSDSGEILPDQPSPETPPADAATPEASAEETPTPVPLPTATPP
jgi:hypothetical protein